MRQRKLMRDPGETMQASALRGRRASRITGALALVVFATIAGSGPAAQAADRRWNGSLSNGDWPANANWSTTTGVANQTPPGSTTGTTNGDTVFFQENVYGTLTPDANRNIKSITFRWGSPNAFVVGSTGGNALLLTSGGSILSSVDKTTATIETVDAPLVLEPLSASSGGTYSFISSSGGNSGSILIIGGTVTGGTTTAPILLTLGGTNPGTGANLNVVAGIISDGGATGKLGITKSGGGTWAFSAANTYTGDTTVTGGTLKTGATNSLPANSAVNITTGTLDVSGFANTVLSLTIGSGGTLDLGVGNLLTCTGQAKFDGKLIVTGTPIGALTKLIAYRSCSGTFATATLPTGYKLQYNATELDLVAIP